MFGAVTRAFGAIKVNLAALLGELWMRSLRVRIDAPADFGPGILGCWHRDLLVSFAAFKGRGVHALVSESGDGEFLARAIARMGFRVSRGSDTHGSRPGIILSFPCRCHQLTFELSIFAKKKQKNKRSNRRDYIAAKICRV